MKKIILDCDPGHDDMIAIMLASSRKEIEIIGITTVAGNQTGDKTFQNALKTLTLINRKDIKVAKGFDKPILRELITAPKIHGISGLDGANLPEPEIEPLKIHAVDFIIDTLLNSNEKIYIVPTGPLTNIAISLIKEPKIKEKIEKIVLMGGAIFDSNITPAAEFNIYVDPEAAKIVFNSGIPIVMVGLDVTNKALLTFDDIEKIEKMNGKISSVVGPLLRFFANANKEFFGFNGAPIHDALTISYLIDETTLTLKEYFVDIEIQGELTRGRTIVDVYGVLKRKPNAFVAIDLDLIKFKNMIFEMIEFLDKS
ncbi:MAG: nucleoside hydrolase [Caldisericia bacterium]|jgi:inosine-uridine nucleoside N-ribohydrolase|nr:nucleoside hydrolase [Caldisericia bacterium]